MSTVYLGTIDAGGDGHTLLLAAINQKLGKNYALSDFDFGVPEIVTTPEPTHNTKIKFGPKLTAGYYGVRTVYYNRIHASELGQVIVAYDGEGFLSQLLTKINEKYGVLILETDIFDTAITPPSGGVNQVQVALSFRPESVVFYSSVQIQVGLNDPVGDTEATLPFETYATFAFDQSQQFDLLGTDYAMIEPFSMALSRDNTTLRLSTLTTAIQGTGSAAHVRLRLPQATYDARRAQLPFVGQWIEASTGRSRAISVLADVYELSTDGYDWTLIENGLGITSDDAAAVSAGYAQPYVKMAVQASNGDVYALARKPGEDPAIWKIEAGTHLWSKMGFLSSRMQCLTPALWAELEVHDFLHSNNRLWILIRSNTAYKSHVTKGLQTPSVEVFHTVDITTDYFPLGDTAVRFSDIELNTTGGKWRLVTPPNVETATHCDVAALVTSVKNNNTYAVIYRHQAVGEYLAYLLPSSLLPTSDASREELDIVGYQVALNTIPAELNALPAVGHYLDVVAILSPVEVDNFNRYFLRTGVRGPTKYRAYGLRVMTSVAVRNARTAWKETQLPLSSANKPTLVTTYGAGARNHAIFQNGVAIHRLMFPQDVNTSNFSAILDSTTVLEHHTGFDGVSRIAAGTWVRPAIVELTTTTAVMAAIQDDEAVLAPIGFSFITKHTNGARGWHTAQNAGDLLALRTPSFNYAFMGTVPAVVLAEGTRLLYWSRQGNGLFVSNNQGASWQEFNAAPFFYRQEAAPSPALNILGQATLRLTTENFAEAALVGDTLLIETKCDEPVLAYDLNAGEYNAPKQLVDHMLFEIAANGPNTYTTSGNQGGYGLNALSQHSPRKVFAWDSDANGDWETVGQYSSSPATPYDTNWRVEDYMYNTPGRLVDFSRDVRYLGVRHWFLVEDAGVWKLHFTDSVMPTKTIGLFGTPESPYTTFMPEVNFHLWDYVDDGISYVPYVFYGAGRVILLERIDVNSEFAETHHVLSIPGDNGKPMVPVKMYTANRRDYWFHQQGNGLFKLTYNWDVINEVSSVALVRVFDMSGASLSSLDVLSGCIAGVAARNAPQELMLPDQIPADTFIGWHCLGMSKMHRYANGTGGFYDVEEPRSYDCGYIPETVPGSGEGGAGGGG